jgi:16S rRNA (uracil1498-N3)-methyltransferase
VEGLLSSGDGRRILMRLERADGAFFLREADAAADAAAEKDTLVITLIVGLLKSDQFDAVLRASSELGINVIQPVLCERSVPRVGEAETGKKISRWQRILDEGSKVSGSVFPPKILSPVKFSEVEWDAMPDLRYVAVIAPDAPHISCVRPEFGEMAYAVGPEGDWSPSEISVLSLKKFMPLSLGRRIMRASTAVIVGCGWFRLNANQRG